MPLRSSVERAASALAAFALAATGVDCAARRPADRDVSPAAKDFESAPAVSPVAAEKREIPRAAPPSPTFEAAIRPMLATRCAPCHNPGGSMYARLPFDRPAVVSSHASGVRRRLKGDDLETLERWLATLPASSS